MSVNPVQGAPVAVPDRNRQRQRFTLCTHRVALLHASLEVGSTLIIRMYRHQHMENTSPAFHATAVPGLCVRSPHLSAYNIQLDWSWRYPVRSGQAGQCQHRAEKLHGLYHWLHALGPAACLDLALLPVPRPLFYLALPRRALAISGCK